MKPEEYATLARAEEGHWWYLGLRDFLVKMIARHAEVPPRRILDAGCGTGANLRLMQERYAPTYLGGFDVAEASVASSRLKAPAADVYFSSITDPEIHEAELDLVLSMDVVYMVGLKESLPGLRKLAVALRPGGLFILNLAAHRWLMSEHDVATSTKERYSLRDLKSLPDELGLEPCWKGYRMGIWFPLVLLSRLPSMIRKTRFEEARSDLAPPPWWVNRILECGLKFENSWIARGGHSPWGSSVALVMRKPLTRS